MRRFIGRRGGVGVLIVVAVGLVTAGLAWGGGILIPPGAIPDSNGVLHGCYDTKKGTLRLIDPVSGGGGVCNAKKENPVDWNGSTDIRPPVGTFTPTQLVHGAIVTCASTGNSGLRCNGILVNGLHFGYGGSFDLTNLICNTVTGGGSNAAGSFSGVGAGESHFNWTGTNWTISSEAYYPMDYVVCDAS